MPTDDETGGSTRTGKPCGPLLGLRVLDIATVYAAPFAASLLADLGADVLKVELPGAGDPLRALRPFDGEESLIWAAVSRGKRCITLDLHRAEGQELLCRLAADRDVLFENFRPGTLDQWGLDLARLRAASPGLIVVRVSGYGQSGPHRGKAGFGTPATAFSGYAYISGYPDRAPVLPSISLVDYLAGLFAAIGALAAIYHRDVHHGDAQEVDVALYESMFRLLESVVVGYDRLGLVRERAGDQLEASAPAGVFSAADDTVLVLTTSTERTFRRLAGLMGREDLLTDHRFATNRARSVNRAAINQVVAEWFAARSARDICRACDEAGVPVSPILSVADIFTEPHYAARDMLVEVDHPTLGTLRLPGVVPKFSLTPGSVRSAGARLGEHNDEVYSALGLTADEIAELSEQGII